MHRERVREPRDRMRRLQHLADVERMMIRVVVAHAFGRGEERCAHGVVIEPGIERRQIGESGVEFFQRLGQQRQRVMIECHEESLGYAHAC